MRVYDVGEEVYEDLMGVSAQPVRLFPELVLTRRICISEEALKKHLADHDREEGRENLTTPEYGVAA